MNLTTRQKEIVKEAIGLWLREKLDLIAKANNLPSPVASKLDLDIKLAMAVVDEMNK